MANLSGPDWGTFKGGEQYVEDAVELARRKRIAMVEKSRARRAEEFARLNTPKPEEKQSRTVTRNDIWVFSAEDTSCERLTVDQSLTIIIRDGIQVSHFHTTAMGVRYVLNVPSIEYVEIKEATQGAVTISFREPEEVAHLLAERFLTEPAQAEARNTVDQMVQGQGLSWNVPQYSADESEAAT